jgi:hypothetical protein
MPWRSAKQRRYMHARHAKIAARWDKKYGKRIRPSKGRKARGKKKKKR